MDSLNVHSDIVESTEKNFRQVCDVRAPGCLTIKWNVNSKVAPFAQYAINLHFVTPVPYLSSGMNSSFPQWKSAPPLKKTLTKPKQLGLVKKVV